VGPLDSARDEFLRSLNRKEGIRDALFDFRCLENLHVFRLPALGPALHFEAHRLAFLQRAETVRLNSREVHEDIFAILPRYEAKTLGIVKPLYCTLFHLFLDFPCDDVALRDRKVSGRNRSYFRRDGCKRAVQTNASVLYT